MTMACPFTPEFLDRLLRGDLAEDQRRAAREHLGGDCPDCDEFFAGLDDATRELLAGSHLARKGRRDGSSPALSAEDRDRIFAAVEGNLAAAAAVIRPRFRTRRGLALAAGLILAVSLAFLGSRLWPKPGPTVKGADDVKGSGINLQFLVLEPGPDPEKPQIKRGINQASVSPSARLLFRYRLEHPGWVYIVRVDAAGQGELIYPPAREESEQPAGIYDAAVGDQLYDYPLHGLDRLQTFCALTYAARPDRRPSVFQGAVAEIERNRKQLGFNRLRTETMDCFEIKVEDPWGPEVKDGR
jgi:hypothetical protein